MGGAAYKDGGRIARPRKPVRSVGHAFAVISCRHRVGSDGHARVSRAIPGFPSPVGRPATADAPTEIGGTAGRLPRAGPPRSLSHCRCGKLGTLADRRSGSRRARNIRRGRDSPLVGLARAFRFDPSCRPLSAFGTFARLGASSSVRRLRERRYGRLPDLPSMRPCDGLRGPRGMSQPAGSSNPTVVPESSGCGSSSCRLRSARQGNERGGSLRPP